MPNAWYRRSRFVTATGSHGSQSKFEGPFERAILILDQKIAELEQLKELGEVDPDIVNNRSECSLALLLDIGITERNRGGSGRGIQNKKEFYFYFYF